MTGPLPGLRWAWRVVGALALAGIAFLAVGWILPGTWEVTRSRDLTRDVSAIFPLLSDLEAWDEWMPWDNLDGLESSGQERTWSDPNAGTGALRLIAVEADSLVRYEVDVEGGLSTVGELRLRPHPGGAQLIWTERGDFGRNPLLAYFALSMDRLQGTEMEKSLARLSSLLDRAP